MKKIILFSVAFIALVPFVCFGQGVASPSAKSSAAASASASSTAKMLATKPKIGVSPSPTPAHSASPAATRPLKQLDPEEAEKLKKFVESLPENERALYQGIDENGAAKAADAPISDNNPTEIPSSKIQDANNAFQELQLQLDRAKQKISDNEEALKSIPALKADRDYYHQKSDIWFAKAGQANGNTEGWKRAYNSMKEERDNLKKGYGDLKLPDKKSLDKEK